MIPYVTNHFKGISFYDTSENRKHSGSNLGILIHKEIVVGWKT